MPSQIVSTLRRGTYLLVMFLLVLCGLTGCHKLRSQLAGTGDDPTGAPAAAGDSGKVKHLHLGGGGGQKTRSLLGGKHSESGEPSEAALARQSHHSMAPVFHWGDGSDGGGHHKSRSHF